MPTWCAAAPARRSSPAIPGSPTGAATRSSRCAASGSAGRARARARHPARVGAGGVRGHGAELLPGRRRASPNTTPSTPRSGSWSRRTSCCEAARAGGVELAAADQQLLRHAIGQIVAGYRAGTRFGIRMDEDGLLAAGVPGVQLTWMDAKVGDWVVTPRIGKPVEMQALWLNALRIAGATRARCCGALRAALASFRALLERGARLPVDVVDVDHVAGRNDPAAAARTRSSRSAACRIRCWSSPMPGASSRRSSAELLTPLGLRSLAPGEPGYRPHYGGGVRERDAAYHQGTVWPWLIGPFVEAWLRVRGDTRRGEARGGRALPGTVARASRASPGSATSRRSPTANRRTRRAAARSRHGRSASCCARAAWRGRAGRATRRPRKRASAPPSERSADREKHHAAQGRDRRDEGGGQDAPRRARLKPAERARLAEDTQGEVTGSGGGRISASASGAPCARTTARRQRLGVLPARSGALARLPLGRGRHRRDQRRAASGCVSRWRCGTATTRS